MILYTLACDSGHGFESWFPSSDAFGEQTAAGLVSCPICASSNVRKAIMAPAVVGQRGGGEASATEVVAPEKTDVTLLDPRQREIRSLIQEFRKKVLADAQDVGTRFPEQARRMHEGDIPSRHIHGQASPEEARALLEDGIMVLPLPALPDDLN